ncbi:MAG: hypothetical protein A2383_01655, partial [Candidatus Pacebacteria bacterium RIFOXYB1_FULL_39_46]
MIIIFILLIAYLGWLVADLIIKNITLEEHLGLSFILGLGIHSVVYFIATLMYRVLPLDSSVLILAGEILLALILSRKLRIKTQHQQLKKKKLNYLEILLILISIGVLGYTALQNLYWPPYLSDSIYLFDFRAKRLADGDINGFFNGAEYVYSENYPPFTSLAHFFFYDAGVSNPKSVYTLLFISFYLVIFGYVKRITQSRMAGLIAATLTVLTPSVWWNSILSMTNVPLMEYLSLAVLYSFDIKEKMKKHEGWLLAAILLGLSTWIRQEPIWFPVILFSVFYLLKDKKIKLAILSIMIFVALSWIWPVTTNWTIPSRRIINQTFFINRAVNDLATSKNLFLYKNKFNDQFVSPVLVATKGMRNSWSYVFNIFILVILGQIFINKKLSRLNILTLFFPVALLVGFIGFSKQYAEWSSMTDAVY